MRCGVQIWLTCRNLVNGTRGINICFWLFDVFSKYGWIKRLKDKKGETCGLGIQQPVQRRKAAGISVG